MLPNHVGVRVTYICRTDVYKRKCQTGIANVTGTYWELWYKSYMMVAEMEEASAFFWCSDLIKDLSKWPRYAKKN